MNANAWLGFLFLGKHPGSFSFGTAANEKVYVVGNILKLKQTYIYIDSIIDK